ncbi:phosphonate C-P lyase system protein PhnG [Anaerosporobacter sp.]|uniref:phosphonate C-P lyase system protein PhnG n=1 Tax=Anaerosporobacter sp. TaxID=1872529 RepID=UPI00286F6ED0|nr:phosphonate C-P lyase system protein PhnG [Anaerosporobacter sp.]
MDKKRLSRILAKCEMEVLNVLVQPVMKKYTIKVLRNPSKTMVLIRMKETVAKADFYLGEMLACEAMVEVEGVKGFAVMAGDNREKVFHAAIIDAVLKGELPEAEEIVTVLEKEEKKQYKREQMEIRMHEETKVKFDTLDVNY